jgi:transcriptional regulator with XRE-family HTH domain
MKYSTVEIGGKIRTARRAKGITQQQVCDATGISKSYYSRIETGKISASIEKYAKILKFLGLKFEDIIQV